MGQHAIRTFVAVVCLVACEPPESGVIRRAPVAFAPAPDRVRALVRAVPGVRTVDCDGPTRNGPEDVFACAYRGKDISGVIQFVDGESRTGTHVVRYEQSNLRRGTPWSRAEVDSTLRVMRDVEARLDTGAGLAGLRRASVQVCYGSPCP